MKNKSSLSDWLIYIEQAHTKEIDMGLSRTIDLIKRLSIDFSSQTVVTVGGTNGKGTTCALIEQVCLKAGLSVGVYSSPHLVSFCERIRLNGELIDEVELCAIFEKIDIARQNTPLTYFEFATLAALKAFSDHNFDLVILEVGLGGRLDAVNAINTDIAVITSIGLDHQGWLGDTKEKIAYEKAGIFRANKPAIIGEPQAQKSMLDHAIKIGAQLILKGQHFIFDEEKNRVEIQGHMFSVKDTKLPKQNVSTALATINAISNNLSNEFTFLIPETDVQAVIDRTQVAGRHHVIREHKDNKHCAIILDVAHNEDSSLQLSRLIRTYRFNTCHIVVGMLKDKNVEISLRAFEKLNVHWYCASLPTQRGENAARLVNALQTPADEKRDSARSKSSVILAFSDVKSAYIQALKDAQADDIILVMGSFLTVAAVLEYHASA
jgi:dihydrofolate synthase/folylpolyglutamate synthase